MDKAMGRPRRVSPLLTTSHKTAAGDAAADADAETADGDVAADADARAREEGVGGRRLLTPTHMTTTVFGHARDVCVAVPVPHVRP